MMDDRIEERLREAAQDYHRPPDTPREDPIDPPAPAQ